MAILERACRRPSAVSFSCSAAASRARRSGGRHLLLAVFVVLFVFLETVAGRPATLVLYPPFFWARGGAGGRSACTTAASRPWWLLVLAIPVLGPLWLLVEPGPARGTPGENQYGADPLERRRLPDGEVARMRRGDHRQRRHAAQPGRRSGRSRRRPASRRCRTRSGARTVPVSVGGGHFSMGGQTASPGSLHLDMRRLNRVLEFSPAEKTIRVQAGIRWCDIQQLRRPARPRGQDHADLRQLHRGRLAQRQRARPLRGPGPADPVGALRSRWCWPTASWWRRARRTTRELFYGAIGGYGALGRHRRGRARPGRQHPRRAGIGQAAARATTPRTSARPVRDTPASSSTTPTSTRRTTRACAR